jgi:hypothetical protein
MTREPQLEGVVLQSQLFHHPAQFAVGERRCNDLRGSSLDRAERRLHQARQRAGSDEG